MTVKALRTSTGTDPAAYLRELADLEDLDGFIFCYRTEDGRYWTGWLNMDFEQTLVARWYMDDDINRTKWNAEDES